MSFDRKAWKRQYRETHREEIRAYQHMYDTTRRVRTRKDRRREGLAAIRRKYDLTVGQYLELAEAQSYTCPLCQRICGDSERLAVEGMPRKGLRFCVDHDHETGRVRGLLCVACNTLLGRFGDKPENIEIFLSRVRSYLGLR